MNELNNIWKKIEKNEKPSVNNFITDNITAQCTTINGYSLNPQELDMANAQIRSDNPPKYQPDNVKYCGNPKRVLNYFCKICGKNIDRLSNIPEEYTPIAHVLSEHRNQFKTIDD